MSRSATAAARPIRASAVPVAGRLLEYEANVALSSETPYRWLEMVGRDARDELTPAVDVDLVENGLQMVLHGVHGDAEPVGDLLGGEALKNELCDIPFAPGQAVGLNDERRDLGRAGGLDDHCRLALGCSTEAGAVEHKPASAARVGARPRNGGRRLVPASDRPCAIRDRGECDRMAAFARVPEVDELVEPSLGGRGDRRDVVLVVEQDEPWAVSVPLAYDRVDQQRPAEALCQSARDPGEEGRFLVAEVRFVSIATDGRRSPACRIGDEGRAKLPADSQRAEQLPKARALLRVATGGAAQNPHWPRASCQEGPFVDVLDCVLAPAEGRQPLADEVLHVAAGHEEGRGVGRVPADALVGHDSADQLPRLL